MCLIEVKNSPKPVVSCAMSAKACLNNNAIFTQSPLVKKARENILEFLLLNHPLDCPICDQGGECDLQDQSFFFGITQKRFYSLKRFVTDKNIGPIVKTLMTRCIHCTRCVRFADEIAGVGNLGIFGRGLQSEIGTYINKVFKSELSGNVIDLCPVGALTAKPYPFLGRSWELKNITGIDFSDGFGTNINIFLKNNKIIKVLPATVTKDSAEINWISDKTRFSFDGMFSPERITKGSIFVSKTKQYTNLLNWKDIFTKIVQILYFQDHLSRHFYTLKKLTIVFNYNISLEVLNLLNLLSNKYTFLNIRKIESSNIINHSDHQLILNSFSNKHKLLTSNLCLLINTNPRFEGTNVNIKLRQRFLKGNFKIASIGSLKNLNLPIQYLGSNVNILKSIAEGNHLFCKQLQLSSNPIIICNSEVLKRKDSNTVLAILETLKQFSSNELNFLNSSINEAGVYNLNNFKKLEKKDLLQSFSLYFLNNSFSNSNIKKLVELKSLNLFNYYNSSDTTIFIEHNHGTISYLSKIIKESFNISNYFNLPNKTFFESTNTYINTTGHFKKNIECIPNVGKSKDDWSILRKLFSCTKHINFTQCLNISHKINFNFKNLTNFKNFVNFLNYPVKSLSRYSFYFNDKSLTLILKCKGYNKSKSKIFPTKLQLWLEDFYISGKDSYSNKSSTMIKCSKIYRKDSYNFSIL